MGYIQRKFMNLFYDFNYIHLKVYAWILEKLTCRIKRSILEQYYKKKYNKLDRKTRITMIKTFSKSTQHTTQLVICFIFNTNSENNAR